MFVSPSCRPDRGQKQENDVQNDRCVRRRVLLDYSADYPHRKRPPGKNYGYSFSNQGSTELRFSKKQKLVFLKRKQTQSQQQQQQQPTPTSKLWVIINRLHLQQASMRESMSKPIRYRASNEVGKSEKKKKRNKTDDQYATNRYRTPASINTSHRPQNPLKQQRDTRASRRYRKTTVTTRNNFLFPDTKTHKTKTKKKQLWKFSVHAASGKTKKCYSKLLQEKTKKRKQRQKQRQIGTSLRMYKFTTPNRISKATSDSHLQMILIFVWRRRRRGTWWWCCRDRSRVRKWSTRRRRRSRRRSRNTRETHALSEGGGRPAGPSKKTI